MIDVDGDGNEMKQDKSEGDGKWGNEVRKERKKERTGEKPKKKQSKQT